MVKIKPYKIIVEHTRFVKKKNYKISLLNFTKKNIIET